MNWENVKKGRMALAAWVEKYATTGQVNMEEKVEAMSLTNGVF